ncbi:hypothetical protein Rs2_17843 [Raphanus sativus]|nr:hypothetical protein Rs2_17843 [Raphanus sativus]
MTRYATIDEVNAAILQLEEREHASSADTMRPGISSNGKGTSTNQKEAANLEEKQDIKRLVLEYNVRERDEEESNGLGTQVLNWGPGGGRGSRHRFVYHQGGGGSYHS